MKILEINVFYYRFGGSETVMFNTCDILKEAGHEVVNFALKWNKNLPSPQSNYFPESKETRKGFLKPIKDFFTYFYHKEAAKKLDLLLTNEKPDIAQVHLFWGQITPSVLPVLKKHNIPIVFTIHDYRMVCPNYTFRNGLGNVCEECYGKRFWKCLTNKCCQGSYVLSAMMSMEMYFRNTFFFPPQYIDGLIYVSNFAKQQHEKYMPALKDKQNIVLYNLSDNIIDSAKKPLSNRYYLYFGRLSYEKGISTLIRVMIKHPELDLKIVGAGALTDDLKRIVDINNCSNIEFLGFKKGDDLQELIMNAYFIIVPSEWYENNPMTIIEGYSVSTPVIGARIGGIPEIVEDGNTGFLFESGNENDLENVILRADSLSENAYKKLQDNALLFARKNFDRNNYYPRLIEFYKRFIN